MSRTASALLGLGVLVLAADEGRPRPGTYWQQRACSQDYRWCVEWVRVSHQGMEVGCVWKGDRAERASDDGNPKLYLTDELGRRHDHTATTGAAAYGHEGASLPNVVKGTFRFPPTRSSARRFAFHDDERGQVIPSITLDDARWSSEGASHAVLRGLREADAIVFDSRWSGLGSRRQRIRLARVGEGFEGEAVGESPASRRAARQGLEPTDKPRTVKLTADQARLLLDTLVESAVYEGKYEPAMLHLDGYVSFRIDVVAAGETFAFSTQSQGEDHVPWALQARGQSWVVPSSHPMRAMRIARAIAEGAAVPDEALESPAEQPADPLRLAAQKDDALQVKTLLAQGADPDRRTPYDGETSLTAAARLDRLESVEALIEGGADPKVTNARGMTAERVAASAGHTRIVKLLLGAGKAPADKGSLPAAAHAGDLESVRAILAHGPVADADAAAALVAAALANRQDMLRTLLDAKAPIEGTGDSGLTALGASIAHGHLEATRLLLAAGASTGAHGKDWPALHRAANVGHADVVGLLIEAGAPVQATYDGDGTTALFLARTPAVASALLRAGARPDAVRADGATPLVALASQGLGWLTIRDHPRRAPPRPDEVGTARVLLDAGASVGAKDAKGRTALHRAVADLFIDDNVDLAILLLERGADPNAPDPEGMTPVRRAMDQFTKTANGPGGARVIALFHALAKAGAQDMPSPPGTTPGSSLAPTPHQPAEREGRTPAGAVGKRLVAPW